MCAPAASHLVHWSGPDPATWRPPAPRAASATQPRVTSYFLSKTAHLALGDLRTKFFLRPYNKRHLQFLDERAPLAPAHIRFGQISDLSVHSFSNLAGVGPEFPLAQPIACVFRPTRRGGGGDHTDQILLRTQGSRCFSDFPGSPGRLRPGRHRLDLAHHQRGQLLTECFVFWGVKKSCLQKVPFSTRGCMQCPPFRSLPISLVIGELLSSIAICGTKGWA